jgi:hypothetical protein
MVAHDIDRVLLERTVALVRDVSAKSSLTPPPESRKSDFAFGIETTDRMQPGADRRGISAGRACVPVAV